MKSILMSLLVVVSFSGCCPEKHENTPEQAPVQLENAVKIASFSASNSLRKDIEVYSFRHNGNEYLIAKSTYGLAITK